MTLVDLCSCPSHRHVVDPVTPGDLCFVVEAIYYPAFLVPREILVSSPPRDDHSCDHDHHDVGPETADDFVGSVGGPNDPDVHFWDSIREDDP